MSNLGETLGAAYELSKISVDGHEVTVKRWLKGQEFMEVRMNYLTAKYSREDFWRNLITNIEEEFNVKVTGTLGPVSSTESAHYAHNMLLIFYQPKPEKKHLPGYPTP